MSLRPVQRAALAVFLRARRESLSPQAFGLPRLGRSRTPGLRRAEVAELASMSANYVEQLEQGRGPQPSPAVLAALSRALRLTSAERDHLYWLAGHTPLTERNPTTGVDGALAAVLRSIRRSTLALIVDDLGRVLAENDASIAYFGRFHDRPPPVNNIVWRWFTDSTWRASAAPTWLHDTKSDAYVADLRSAVGRRGHDPEAVRFVAALRKVSADFTRRWDRYRVDPIPMGPAVLVGPDGAVITMDCATIPAERTGQRLFLFAPPNRIGSTCPCRALTCSSTVTSKATRARTDTA